MLTDLFLRFLSNAFKLVESRRCSLAVEISQAIIKNINHINQKVLL